MISLLLTLVRQSPQRAAIYFAILEARVNRLAFESQDTEDTFMDAAKRFLPDESLQGFNTQSEFAEGQ